MRMIEAPHVLPSRWFHLYQSCTGMDCDSHVHMEVLKCSNERPAMKHLMGIHNPRVNMLDTRPGICKTLIICDLRRV